MSRPPISLDRLTPDQRRLFELRRRQRGISTRPPVRIPRRPAGGEPAECSSGQRRFWFLEQLDGGAGTHNIATAVRLRGRLDRARLEASLGVVAARHEALRTTFHLLDGQLFQHVHPHLAPEVFLVDVAGCPCPERAARAAAAEEARRPFDLARGPLLRLALLRLANREHLALLTLHHIVADGWSLGVLVRELAAAYGTVSPGAADLPELPIQYADFAHWQRAELAAGAFDVQLAGWRRRLAGAPALELPADRPREIAGTGGGGTPASTLELPAGGVEALRELAQAEGATLFMALCAAFAFLLARLAGQREVVVGTLVAGRGPAETHGLIGLFLNTLALRLDLGAEPSLRQLIGRAREVALAAFADQDLPFDRLVEELAPERQLGRSPLFQAMLSTQGATVPRVEMPGLVLEPAELDSVILQVDLSLTYDENDLAGRPRLALAYRRDLFDRATAERWGGHLVRWIAAAAADPDRAGTELDLLAPAERHQLLREWNDTGVAEDGLFLHQLFEAQAARRPEAPALIHPGGELSYGALDRRASELAAVLRGLGVGPEARVAVCLERSPELLVALLAVWKAGGAYLPLDPALPRERRRMLLADAGPAVLVTRRALAAELLEPADGIPALHLDEPLPTLAKPSAVPPGPPALSPDSLAWVMYTSGSTGTPNGVLVPHRGAVPLLRYLAEVFRMTPESRVLQVIAVGFDVSLMEIFLALANGGSLCQVTEEERLSPGALAERLEQRGVDTVVCTPAFLDLLPEPRLGGVRVVGVGGEACPAALAERWSQGRRLVNCYGPTEATIYATFEILEREILQGAERRDRPPAIGRPSPGMEAHVLDSGLMPVPPGAPGELALGGIGLARGYLDRPHRTAERFVPHPFAAPGERPTDGNGGLGARPTDRNGGLGARLYRTGDLVRRRPDGRLEFLGRLDHQVKIRGLRIELGEIEAVLRGHPEVLTTAVLAPQRAGAERRLLAWVVPQPGREASPAELRRFLQERLPAAMVPAHIVPLDALPVTGTGKLDRKALERRAVEIGAEERARTAPRTPAERLVARLWQEVLKVPEVGVDDNFFALGGSSIQAAILTNRLEEELGERVWVAALFDAPTVERLTASLLATCPAGMARAIGEGAVARASGEGAVARVIGEGAVARASGLDPDAVAPMAPLRWESGAELPARLPARIPRRQPGGETAELSSGQRRFWFLEQLDGGAGTYHIAAAVGLRGRLDPARLAASLGAVVSRHEILRTTFHLLDGNLVQRIHPSLAPEVSLVDLSAATAPEDPTRAATAAWLRRPFDLARGPLLRLALLRLAEGEHLALLALHHIVADGWSLDVLVRELAAAYGAAAADRPADLPELPIQYADFALWQRARLAAGELDGQLAEWRRELAGAPVLELPADRPRAQEHGAPPGGTVDLPFGDLAPLRELAQAQGATPFMALLAAFSFLLARLAGQREVVVGTPVAGRGPAETHGLIGLFVNTLALRLDLAGVPSPRRLVGRAREVALAAFARQDLPFDRLVEELAPERQPARSPVFQAMLTAQNAPVARVELPGLVLEPRDLDSDTLQVDLGLTLDEGGVGRRPRLALAYRRDLFDRATAERWGGHLVRWIAAAAADPDRAGTELDLLAPAERHQLLREWNDTEVAEDGLFLHQLFEAQAARRPEAPALIHPGGELSYGALDRRASELAAVLRGLGVGPEARVAVCLERSPELLIALLAVWKAGGAYLPLDPALPRERRRMLLADAGPAVLVTRRALAAELLEPADGLPALHLDEPLPTLPSPSAVPPGPPALSPDSLAWVMYTSGSTGTPNGVLVPHRGAVPLLRYLAEAFRMTPESRVLQVIAVGFDVSLMEIFLALANGGSLCQVTEEERLSPGALAERLEQRGVDTVVCTPAFLDLLPEPRLGGVRVVGVGGEACPAALAERWSQGRRLVNCYGPTEATIYATFEILEGAEGAERLDRPPAIGRPSPGMEAHVLDSGLVPVPPGAPGELALGGIGLARGYLDRPHRTAERFVPHPFAAAPGERLYRTGDLVRRRPDGRLEFLGRLDHQVKIRGLRIELGEIEAVLRGHPSVLTAAVLAPQRAGAERRLLAWVVPQPGREASPAELCRFLEERLPAAMVPAHIVPLDALPVTGTGKLDRKALERQAVEIGTEERARTAPRTPAEHLVARLWQEVLKVSEVGVDDNFFALGGSSIQAAILTNRLEEELGERVWVAALFDAPTVERLTTSLLATCPAGMARATGVAAASSAHETAKPPLPLRRRIHAGPPPLSFAQERLWFLDRLEPGSPAYVIPAAVRLRGVLDAAALAASLAEVVRRHAVLRTRFGLAGGRPVQIVDEPSAGAPPALPLIDLAGLGPRAEAEASRLAAAEAVRPFDLAAGPLLRTALLCLGREEHAVLVSLHHIAGDAWSIGVLVSELAALYPAFSARRPSPLPEPPVQYADFAVWQREQLAGEELARQLAWWRERLAGAPLVLELPADRPRRPVQSFRGAAVTAPFPPRLAAGLAALGAHGGEGVTPFMILLAGFQALLSRITGQPALVVGSTIANRTRRELENLIGFFVNTLVLRADLATEERFATHLARVRADTVDAFLHQDLPFELLVEELRPPRDLARAPLVQVIFQMQNAPAVVLELPGLRLEPLAVQAQTAKFDLVVTVAEPGGEMALTWGYSTDLFDRATVARLAGHFATLLAGAVADPDRWLGDLPLLAPEERHQLLVESSAVLRAAAETEVLHRRFARVAAARPEAVAAVCGGGRWTYGELAARARELAWRLARAGVRPGDRVGLFLERSLDLVAAVLGVVESGAAYVPLDPAYPVERVAFVLGDSGVKAVVSQRGLEGGLAGLPEGVEIVWVERGGEGSAGPDGEPLAGVRAVPESPAYVIYTSGSTGRPKGVEVAHRQVGRLFDSTAEWFGFGPADVWTLFHSIAFDFSVWELWGPLLTGGRLVVVPYEVSRSPEAFYELLAREGVTVLNQTPSAFRQLIWAEESVRAREAELPALRLREVIFGGEALEPASLAPWVARHGDRPRLVNMYGITETTVHVTYRPLSAAEVRGGVGSVIGVPIPDLAVYLVDRRLQPAPLGVPGEIVVGGAGLASGYVGRPDLTAERFVPDPFGPQPGARLYHSGDLARRRPPYPDKDLEYLGRIDHQIKIRGFRIELGEIEAALVALPGVREAAVVAREDGGEKRLVAYVTGEEGELPELAEVRDRLAATLPDYMLPSALVQLPALPLTVHGKVDRRALPAPGAAPAAGRVAPRTALERELAALFAEALRVDAVGLDDDFFELGGNSISGAVLINRLQREVGEIVHVVAIFDAPTVRRLAVYLGTQHREAVLRRWGASPLDETAVEGEGGRLGTVDRAAVQRLRGLIPAPGWLARSRVRSVGKNPRAIFILSPPRSGSTLLRVMLAGHPALFAPPELELLGFETLAERSAAFASPRDSFWLEGAVRAVMAAKGCGAEEAREELAAAEREGLSTLELYGRLQSWLGGRILVDKTPSYALSRAVLERAEEGFEEPFYIHLVRHPLGMIQSFEEAKLDQIFLRQASAGPEGFGRRELAELIWVVSQENIRGFLAGVPAARRHELRFEELVRDPEGTLAALCAALGLGYEPAMARPYAEGDQGSRMTDGLHAASRMLGDVKFHQHRGVDAGAAERWRESRREAELGAVTIRLARSLGYAISEGEEAVRIPAGGWRPGEPLPLSFAQERLWFIDRLEPGSPAYNIPAAVRISGGLSVPALAASLAGVVRRHAALRTRFAFARPAGESTERPAQIVDAADASGAARLPLVDLGALPAPASAAEVHRLAGAAARTPFDLARGPLLRALLLRTAADEHVALLTLHHIVGDGWSMAVLIREIGELYRAAVAGEAPRLPELPVQYPDFALWQRERLSGAELERQVAFWRERLAGAPTALDLPADRPRPAVLSLRGADLTAELPAAVAAALGAVARRARATPFMTLLAGFTALAGRITGRSTLVVGSTIANRTRRELEDLIGFFVNTLALRSDLAGDEGFAAHLRRVREATLAAWAHQDLPFEKLVEELRPPRDPSRAPLVQVLFQMQNVPAAELDLPGVRLAPLVGEGQSAKFDLVVSVAEHEGRFTGTWRFSTDLFDRTTIERLAGHFATLLEAAAADPEAWLDELPLLREWERHQLLVESSAVLQAAAETEVLHRRFARVAAARPEAVAAVCRGERWSYGELAVRARRMAWRLARAGVRPGDRVGLFLERSLDLVAAVLGVVECGAAYVPLDPAYPAERVAFVLGDSGVKAVVSERGLEGGLAGLPEGVEIVWVERGGECRAGPDGEPLAGVRAVPESPAYVIYTSGSTGRPKGVEVSHAQVGRLFDSTVEWFGFGPADVWTLFHSIAFDFSVWELWGPLLTGGRLVVVPYEVSRSPEAFYELLAREGVTVLNQTPSAFRQLIWAEESVRARQADLPALRLREVIFGGEALEPASLAPWVARHGDRPRLVNMYGITETTVHVTYRPVSAAEVRSGVGSVIGVPIPDLAVYLVDRQLQPVPLGVPGEIVVGGAGLASGYVGRPDLTAERFVPAPFGLQPGARQIDSGAALGARLYRSGDLARRRPPYPDKDLEYLGRIDHQIKIRGFRIELGEIEAALAALPGVREAAVVAREDGGEKRLVAYVAGEEGALPELAEVRARLAATLPDYMLPSALIRLPALPLTVHGKVDRRALPAPGAAPAAGRVAPRTALEHELAALFAEALRVDAVGLDDDFFELGGNSISGAVLINRLQREVGEIVHVVAIFDAPTVRRLAVYLGTQHREAVLRRWGASSLDETAVEGEGGGRLGTVDQAAVQRLRGLIPAPSWLARSRVRSVRKNPRAIFVLSPPRSGSTLLRVMLAGHPALFAPPELELLGFDTLAERSAAFGSPRDSFWLEGAVRAVMAAKGCGAEEAREELAAAEREGLSTLELYGRLQSWLGGRILVDKTPSYALSRAVLERAEEGFEEPFYIHLVRHPLGMIQSFEEAKLDQIFLRQASAGPEGFGRRELAELIWVVSQENIRGFLAGVPAARRHELRFEELVRDPEGTLAALCTALGLGYEPAMARPYEEGHQGSRMTDGLHAASRMLGDVKFHQHRGVDAGAAERWRESRREAELGEVTRDLARALGYEAGPVPGAPAAVRIAPTWVPGTPLPLSFAQERLWFLDRLEPGSPAYHLTSALRLSGALDLAALDAAVAGVVRRHAALRTTFPADLGGPVQRVADAADVAGLRWPVVDLAALPAARQEAEVLALAQAEARRPFDLAAGPLLRTLLLRLTEREHAAVVVQHHIVSDGWSMGIFARELVACYAAAVAGVPPRLPELPVQYPDFALWQRQHLDGPALADQLAWWRQRLAGAPPVLELPFDRPRASAGTSAGRKRPLPPLSGELAAALGGLGRRHGASLFMTLFAGFSALLARASNQPDLVVGSPIAGRNRAEIEGLIGFFVNTLALRADLRAEPSFRALLAQVRETVLGAFAHQDLPFEKLVADLAPERNLQAAPLFQVMFALQNAAFQGFGEELAAPGLAVRALASDAGASKFDLLLGVHEVHEAPGGISGTLGYRTDLFDGATVERLGRHFAALLAAVAADPDRPLSGIPLLGAAERQALLVEWNDPVGQEPRSGLVHRLVAAQAARRPAAPAVVDGATGAVQTYGELVARAGRIARRLRALGVGPETPVGVYLDRCLDLPAVMLGVFASGGTYLPLDPDYPAERLAFLLADATQGSGRATPVLTRAGLRDDVAAVLPGARVEVIEPWLAAAAGPEDGLSQADGPQGGLDPENAAYVIYTSGSTGTPKGVVVSHRALANRTLYLADVLTADGSWLHKAAIGFDVSLAEVLSPLAAGGRVVLVPPGGAQDSSEVLRVIGEHRLTHVGFTTPVLAVLLDEPGFDAAFRTVRNVGVGGEAVPAELVERFARRHGAELWNRYGPTETTISVTAWRFRPGERGLPPIGRPVAAAALYVLDRQLRPVPPGVAGEICIGGITVARGYLGRPDLTAAVFCPDPYTGAPNTGDLAGGARELPVGARELPGGARGGARLYRTGDRGRFRADGALEFLGRLDRQVKVRGFRVELGEIESALLRHPAVREAAVVDRAAGATRSLVAFVTAAADPSALAAADLREALGRSLPAWMVPAAFVTLPALPISPMGKVDRRALEELAAAARDAPDETAEEPAEPSGPLAELEELIAGLWQELLGVRRVRRDDDFFALGGHSLLATQLVLRLRALFGIEVPLRAVFESPTLAEMAAALAAHLQATAEDEAAAPLVESGLVG